MRPAQALFVIVCALLGIGVVMIHSAGMQIDDAAMGDLLAVFKTRNVIYAGLAIAAFLLASRLDVREVFNHRGVFNRAAWVLIGALVLVGLTLVPGVGHNVNGASRWLKLGPVTFQPSELVKFTMVIALAWWGARRGGVLHKFGAGLLPALAVVGFACALIVLEDLGTAALIAAVSVCLLVAGGAKLWQVGTILPLAGAGFVAAIMTSPYRVKRLTAFIDPWGDPDGTGYHAIQSLLAFGNGGVTGRGLGNGIQKFGYVPEDTTDFIFAVIAEELGLAGAGLVIGLYVMLLWVGMQVVRDCTDRFGRLLALGVLLTVSMQAAMNVAVVTVVVPTKGIALPLISAGGTGWIVTAFALGLVAGLDNANALEESREPEMDTDEQAWDEQAWEEELDEEGLDEEGLALA